MDSTPSTPAAATDGGRIRAVAVLGLAFVLAVALALITWKASAALGALEKVQATHTLAPKAEWIATGQLGAAVRPLASAANYLKIVWIALAFGVVLGAAVKTLVPSSLLTRLFASGGANAQLAATLAGAPLMLCSCCVAPLFEGVYARTRKLGPALALLVASPALNPFTLTLTYLLFPPVVFWARLAVSAALVVLGTGLLGKVEPAQDTSGCAVDAPDAAPQTLAREFGAALWQGLVRTLPVIVLGIVLAAVVADLAPVSGLSGLSTPLAVALVAVLALPLALPTFSEIPLALALSAAGLPTPAIAALLISGPAVNLASLLTIRRAVGNKAALATTGAVLGASVACAALVAVAG